MNMKLLLTLCCSVFFATQLFSQTTYQVSNLRVSGFSHNEDCGGFSNPEPNFRVRWRVQGQSYGAVRVVRPGANSLACGSYTTNVPLLPNTYNGSNSVLQFDIQGWEDDGCGSDDTFDDNCFFDDDDYEGTVLGTISLNDPNTTHTFNLSGNNYTLSISYDITVLPVVLTDFVAKRMDKDVLLSWQTAQESNSFEFEVERSANAKDFELVAILDAAGNSDTAKQYEFVDEQAANLFYYRLKMVDLDGSFKYSAIESVAAQQSAAKMNLLNLYPNPTSGQLNLSLEMATSHEVEILITDMMGRQVQQQKIIATEGKSSYTIDVQGLKAGQYIMHCMNAQQMLSRSFVVVD